MAKTNYHGNKIYDIANANEWRGKGEMVNILEEQFMKRFHYAKNRVWS